MGNCVCPVPTALPRTGITDSRNTAVGAAIVLFAAAAGVFYFSQKEKYVTPHHTKTHTHKKA
jgi:LPXTG-motif cell wall-anchored protein